MVVKKSLVDFLQNKEIQELLAEDDFDTVYEMADEGGEHLLGFREKADISNLTKLFYAAGIDPLQYLSKVPFNFLIDSDREKVIMGPNVRIISVGCLSNCIGLKRIHIESAHSIVIYWNAFTFCPSLKDIVYIGTCNDWITKVDVKSQNNAVQRCTIHCRDGNLKWNSKTNEWERI